MSSLVTKEAPDSTARAVMPGNSSQDLPPGRNVDEAIRMLDALRFFEENREVCPANWKPGEEGMNPTAEGVSEYLARHAG